MLKSYKDVTIRSLIFNKKKSIFTLVGIVLSIMLITAFCNFSSSIKKTAIDNIKLETGKWHLNFYEADSNLKQVVIGSPKVDGYVFTKDYMETRVNRVNVNIKWFEGNLEYGRPIKLKQGNLPGNDKEIALDDWAISRIKKDAKIGEIIDLKDDKTNKITSFKLVGILNGDPSSNYSIAYSKKDVKLEKDSFLYVKFKENDELGETIKEFKDLEKNQDNIKANTPLLDFLGVKEYSFTSKGINAVSIIVIAIIILATISIIYNAFNISVVQRTKEFGTFRMLGCTPKQIKELVLREATILSIIAIPLGILLGILSLEIVLFILNNMTAGIRNFIGTGKVESVISYKAIILSGIIGLLTVYTSVLLPTKLASKITPLVAVNGFNFIKKEKIKKTRGFIAKRLLKVEGLIAYKNLKRNRKRYRVTVFSMSISIILVISFTAGMNVVSLKTNDKKNNISRNIDIITYIDKNNKIESYDKVLDEIKKISGVKSVYIGYLTPNYSMLLDKKKVNEQFREIISDRSNGIYKFNNKDVEAIKTSMTVYRKDEMNLCKNKLLQGKIDFNDMENNDGVIIINNGIWNNGKKQFNGKAVDINIGDNILIDLKGNIDMSIMKESAEGISGVRSEVEGSHTDRNIQDRETYKVKVLAVIEDTPFDSSNYGIRVIMSPRTANNINKKTLSIIKEDKDSKEVLMTIPYSINVVLNDKNKSENISSIINSILSENNVIGTSTDLVKKNANDKNLLIQMQVLFYGFIAVIALISAVNIINIINTNVTLRIKEFASLMSLGMSSKRIRKIVLLEGAFYGIVSSFFGSIVGILISYRIGLAIYEGSSFIRLVPWLTVLLVTCISILIGILSTLPALLKLKKINIIETIKMEY